MVDPASGRVNDSEAPDALADDALLDGALLALGYRSDAVRRRRQRPRACLRARASELGLGDGEYLDLLRTSASERSIARQAMALRLGRMWRDAELWRRLASEVLPTLGAARAETRIWVAEGGAGEEAYTLAMLWSEEPGLRRRPVRILMTDGRPALLARARAARFPHRAARGLPPALAGKWLRESGAELEVAAEARARVVVAMHDLARDPWPFEIDLLLLRNSVFTLWDAALREEAVARAAETLVSHGWLAVGRRERLEEQAAPGRFVHPDAAVPLHRRRH